LAYCDVARWAIKPGDAGTRMMASEVLMCSESMALGPGLCSLLRFLNEARPSLETSLSREADRPDPCRGGGGGGGGGGNWALEVMLVALEGITTDAGRLWKPDMGRAEEGVLVGGIGGGGGCWEKAVVAAW